MAFYKNRDLLPSETIEGQSFGGPPPKIYPSRMTVDEKVAYAKQWHFRWENWNETLKELDIKKLWENQTPAYIPEIGHREPGIGFLLHNDGKKRAMIIVCAGGGMIFKAPHEGMPVAKAFYKMGFNTAVLDFRCQPYNFEVIIGDASRAIRYVRYHADELMTVPDKIAIMGFSGGGRLAGLSGCYFDYGNPNADDPVDRISSRPDAVVMGYAFNNCTAFPDGPLKYNRENQRENCKISLESQLKVDSPPFYLWSTAGEDDPRGLTAVVNRLATLGVPFECHIFPYGPHGMTLADGTRPEGDAMRCDHVAMWVELCRQWLDMQDFVSEKE